MKDQILTMLSQLTLLNGPSGFEDDVVRYIYEKIKNTADSVEIDSFGNIIAFKKGISDKPAIMITAHMDEIGLMVRKVEKNGFLRFTPTGYPSESTLSGTSVKVCGKYNGVIGARSFHTTPPEERNKLPPLNDLFIDIGAKNDQEVMQMGIRVGSQISFVNEFRQLGTGERYASKAIDNRIGCLLILMIFEAFATTELPVSLYGVFTVQEEDGLRGSKMVADKVHPDFAIALDNVLAEDTPDQVSPSETSVQLGRGPVINVKEMTREWFLGIIHHPRLVEYLIDIAQNNSIPYQLGMLIGGVTDGTSIQLSNGGVPTVYVGPPCRYAHSQNETIDLSDVEMTFNLLVEFVKSVTPQTGFRLV